MPIEQIQVNVEQNTYALGQNLVKFVAAIKTALTDGWQIADIEALISAGIADLVPAIYQVMQVPTEEKDNLDAFVAALELSAKDMALMLLGAK